MSFPTSAAGSGSFGPRAHASRPSSRQHARSRHRDDQGCEFVVDCGGTTVREIRPGGQTRTVADGLRSLVGLVLARDGASRLMAGWGHGTMIDASSATSSTLWSALGKSIPILDSIGARIDPCACLLQNLVRQLRIVDRPGENDCPHHRRPASDRYTSAIRGSWLGECPADTLDL